VESQREYARIIGEWRESGCTVPPGSEGKDKTINELAWRFYQHAEQYYRRPDGTQTSEVTEYKTVLGLLRQTYGHTLCMDFGPLQLKTVRQQMVDKGWCRGLINKRVGKIKFVFRWAVENDFAPGSSNYVALLAVTALKLGRSEARESEPVEPVPLSVVEATLPHLPATVADMVRVQLLSGARPGEIRFMRTADLDMSGPIWFYRPGSDQGKHGAHKNAWRGQGRVIAIGPKAQAILQAYLKPEAPTAFLFSPAESRAKCYAIRKANRKTPLTPSQRKRKPLKNPKHAPGNYYTMFSYYNAIQRAVKFANRANPGANYPSWHPHQLRHTRGTELRAKYGVEAAQTVLGHESLNVTEMYAERDLAAAARIMTEIG
jgi:integrase